MANDNHATYAKIGFSVFIGIVAIVGTLIYIGGLRGRGNVILVETYYDKPVSGLSAGSVVNFRGVKVGEVKEISFVGNKYDVEGADNSRIYILMAFNRDILDPSGVEEAEMAKWLNVLVEKAGLRATVTTSGITGLSRIECDYHRPEELGETPKISWTPEHVYVPQKESLFENFSVAAAKVMNQINRMDLNAAWSNINETVESVAMMTDSTRIMLESRQADIDRLIENLTETSISVRELVSELKRNPSLLVRERRPLRLDETAR